MLTDIYFSGRKGFILYNAFKGWAEPFSLAAKIYVKQSLESTIFTPWNYDIDIKLATEVEFLLRQKV